MIHSWCCHGKAASHPKITAQSVSKYIAAVGVTEKLLNLSLSRNSLYFIVILIHFSYIIYICGKPVNPTTNHPHIIKICLVGDMWGTLKRKGDIFWIYPLVNKHGNGKLSEMVFTFAMFDSQSGSPQTPGQGTCASLHESS